MCKRAGLVKYYGIGISDSLKEFAALNSYGICTAFSHCRKHRYRDSKLKCTGEVNHEAGYSLGSITGQKPGQPCTEEA